MTFLSYFDDSCFSDDVLLLQLLFDNFLYFHDSLVSLVNEAPLDDAIVTLRIHDFIADLKLSILRHKYPDGVPSHDLSMLATDFDFSAFSRIESVLQRHANLLVSTVTLPYKVKKVLKLRTYDLNPLKIRIKFFKLVAKFDFTLREVAAFLALDVELSGQLRTFLSKSFPEAKIITLVECPDNAISSKLSELEEFYIKLRAFLLLIVSDGHRHARNVMDCLDDLETYHHLLSRSLQEDLPALEAIFVKSAAVLIQKPSHSSFNTLSSYFLPFMYSLGCFIFLTASIVLLTPLVHTLVLHLISSILSKSSLLCLISTVASIGTIVDLIRQEKWIPRKNDLVEILDLLSSNLSSYSTNPSERNRKVIESNITAVYGIISELPALNSASDRLKYLGYCASRNRLQVLCDLLLVAGLSLPEGKSSFSLNCSQANRQRMASISICLARTHPYVSYATMIERSSQKYELKDIICSIGGLAKEARTMKKPSFNFTKPMPQEVAPRTIGASVPEYNESSTEENTSVTVTDKTTSSKVIPSMIQMIEKLTQKVKHYEQFLNVIIAAHE